MESHDPPICLEEGQGLPPLHLQGNSVFDTKIAAQRNAILTCICFLYVSALSFLVRMKLSLPWGI
jgi:hypothetical protein